MPGTRKGGLKAAKANRERYGEDYYKGIGILGGQKSRGGGFANNPELARRAGKIGGKISRKPNASSKKSS